MGRSAASEIYAAVAPEVSLGFAAFRAAPAFRFLAKRGA